MNYLLKPLLVVAFTMVTTLINALFSSLTRPNKTKNRPWSRS